MENFFKEKKHYLHTQKKVPVFYKTAQNAGKWNIHGIKLLNDLLNNTYRFFFKGTSTNV